MLTMIEAVAAQVFIPLTVGGGVRSGRRRAALLNAGADKVSINTAAVEHPRLVARSGRRYGSQCIVVAIDAKRVAGASRCGGRSTRTAGVVHRDSTRSNGAENGGARRGRNPADQHGPRWHPRRIRSRADARILGCAFDPRHRQRRRRALAHLVDGILQGQADAVLAASVFPLR